MIIYIKKIMNLNGRIVNIFWEGHVKFPPVKIEQIESALKDVQ